MGWRDFASTFHDYIVEAMTNHKGEVLQKGRIIKILISKFPELESKEEWILPSDHCINHTNKGACYCAEKEKAIFERIGHGKYKARQHLCKLDSN